MFERIKCYRKTKKVDKFLQGCRQMSELLGDEKGIQEIDIMLEMNAYIRNKMWFNRKIAIDCNLEYMKRGF